LGTIGKRHREESLAMYTGDLACERLFYGPALIAEQYYGRALLNPSENPAHRISRHDSYRSSINGVWLLIN
jgi:hypothetical protein